MQKFSDNKLHPKLTLQLFTSDKCFGPGVAVLLEKIIEHNSLRQAASDINMSYSKAWTIIRRAEKELGFALLVSKTGGADGGGATLTDEAMRLLRSFRECEQEINAYCSTKYTEYFSWISDISNKEE